MTSKIIVTLVGKDHAGIIAAVCNYFAENDVNILDLSMTTIQDYINMILIVDVTDYKKTFPGLRRSVWRSIRMRPGTQVGSCRLLSCVSWFVSLFWLTRLP